MNRALARRYALALAEILFAAKMSGAKKAKHVQQARAQLESFVALLGSHSGLRNALASPAISFREKLAVVDSLRRKFKWDQTMRNFIAVLVENRRLDELGGVLESFDEEVYARAGLVPVEITSAVELKKAERRDLQKRLEKLTGSEVELRYQKDESILGGLRARMGSTIYDGSLRAHLGRLAARLAEG